MINYIIAALLNFSFNMDYINEHGFSKILPPARYYAHYDPMPLNKSQFDGATRVIVTSTKDLKIKAATEIMEKLGLGHLPITGVSVKSDIAEQPIGLRNGELGAKNRIQNARQDEPGIIYVSIENYIEPAEPHADAVDFALVRLEYNHTSYNQISNGITIPREIYEAAVKDNPRNLTGFDKTVGSYFAEKFGFSSVDWHQSVILPTVTRKDQIFSAIVTSG